jgi:Protein of unknown function (DUF3431)
MEDINLYWVVNNYNNNFEWVKKYTDNYLICDRSDSNLPKKDDPNIKLEPNLGYNIYSYMSFIIDNYDNLPDYTAFIKANILERHISKDEFDIAIQKRELTPLCTQNHKVDGRISYYKDGVYHEKNNSWYFAEYPYKYFRSYPEFADIMGLPCPDYLPFAPGGCYIVPKENILKRSKEFYQKLLEFCSWSQINAESHTIERSLFNIWR